MKTQVLGVQFDNLSPEDALERFLGFLDEPVAHVVVTPNPEMVMLSRRDVEFCTILNSAGLCVPDGTGIAWASKYTQSRIKQRVPGIELVLNAMETQKGREKRWFFLGGAPGVAETAKEAMEARFEGLMVVGTQHGFFSQAEEGEIIQRIKALNIDIVLVGLGFPRQEKWMHANKDKLGAKVLAGVGGSLDVMSGKVKRAPKIFQKLHLEWFYRLLRQPSRIWRQRVLVKFIFTVLFSRRRGELQ